MEKCDFDRQFLSELYLLNFSANWYKNGDIQKLKARAFQLRKYYFNILNIKRPRAVKCTSTFFLIHTPYNNLQRSNLESNIVRLRAQVERGETIRQNLEYELTLARKATNQVKRIAVEKEAETTNNVALLKEQLSESKLKLSGVEQELANTKNVRKNETEEWKRILQTKVIWSSKSFDLFASNDNLISTLTLYSS